MLFVYPIGIPLLYLVLTRRNRASINPHPIAVLVRVLHSLTEENHGITEEIEQLAREVAHVHRMLSELRTQAKEIHGKVYAKQLERDKEEDDKWTAKAQRASLLERKLHFTRKRLTRFLRSHTEQEEADKQRIPAEWEHYLPGYATSIAELAKGLKIMEISLVVAYRREDVRARHLSFLFEAYEPSCWYFEVVECVRRLALTGLLVFTARNLKLRIVIAAAVSMIFLVAYGAVEPFVDPHADQLATYAQLMTWAHLFFALVITTDAGHGFLPDHVLSTVLILLDMSVLLYAPVTGTVRAVPKCLSCTRKMSQKREAQPDDLESVDHLLEATKGMTVPPGSEAQIREAVLREFERFDRTWYAPKRRKSERTLGIIGAPSGGVEGLGDDTDVSGDGAPLTLDDVRLVPTASVASITLDARNESEPDASNGFEPGAPSPVPETAEERAPRAEASLYGLATIAEKAIVVALGPGDGASSQQESVRAARSLFELVSQTSSDDFAVADEATHLLTSLVESDLDAVIKEHTGNSPAWLAARFNRPHVLSALIAARPTWLDATNDAGQTPMYAAAAFGARAAAAVLIRAGADIDSDGNFGHVPTPAYIAAVQGHVGILEELHSAGTPEALQTFHTAVEHTGATPLYGAAASGHASTVRFLLEHAKATLEVPLRASVTDAKKNGSTPLWVACYNGHAEVVGALLDAGADATAQNSEGTSCTKAAIHGDAGGALAQRVHAAIAKLYI